MEYRVSGGVKVLLAPTWELAKPIEADVTVEAEYGSNVKEGTKKTFAHHSGKYKGLPAVSTIKPPPMGSGTILVSHLDLDTIITCLDLMGLGGKISETFRKISGHIDMNGPHRLGDLNLPEEEEDKIQAWWARENALRKLPHDKVSDVTSDIKKAGQTIEKIMDGDPDHIGRGKDHKQKTKALEEESFVRTVGDIIVRKSNQFVNHLYSHKGRVYKGVAALNTKFGSVTISLEKPTPGVSCREIVQRLWGPEAGGHDGIAGSPRGKTMDEKDLQKVAEALNASLKRKPMKAYADIIRSAAWKIDDSSTLHWANKIKEDFGLRCLITKNLPMPHIVLRQAHQILSKMGSPLVRACGIKKLAIRGDMGPNKPYYPNHGYFHDETVAINADTFYNPDFPDDFYDHRGYFTTRPEQTLIHEFGHGYDEHNGMLSLKPDWLKLSGWSETPKPGLKRLVIKEPGTPEVIGEMFFDPKAGFTRFYAKRNSWDDFADCFSFFVAGLRDKLPQNKNMYMKKHLGNLMRSRRN